MGYISKNLRFQTKKLDSWRQTVVSPYTALSVQRVVGASTTKGRQKKHRGPNGNVAICTLSRFLLFLTFWALHLSIVPTPLINSQKMTRPQRSPQTTQVHFLFPQVHLGVEEVFFPLFKTLSSTACDLFCRLRKPFYYYLCCILYLQLSFSPGSFPWT